MRVGIRFGLRVFSRRGEGERRVANSWGFWFREFGILEVEVGCGVQDFVEVFRGCKTELFAACLIDVYSSSFTLCVAPDTTLDTLLAASSAPFDAPA